MRRPSNNPITLDFGAYGQAGYTKANPHGGTDFSHSPDPLIYAPEAGTINYTGWMGDAGNATELTGSNGRRWRFCHQSAFHVQQGQRVAEGQVIGRMGSSGLAYGPHLHTVLLINGIRHDPMNVLRTINTTQGVPMIPDADNYYGRYGIDLALKLRGRVLSREEFRASLVGKTDLRAMEILSDDPEAVAVQNAQTLGLTAIREDWSGKIARLSADVVSEKNKVDMLEAELQVVRALLDQPKAETVTPVVALPDGNPAGQLATNAQTSPVQKQSWLTKLILFFFQKKS